MVREDALADACTLVVTRVVEKGCDDRFRRWADRVARDAGAAPGHREMMRFEQAGGMFHLLQRFADRRSLERWEATAGYDALMAEGDRFSTPRRQEIDGDDPVVRLPSDADAPKWRRFLMTWLSVLPLVIVLNLLLDALPVTLPGPARTAVSSFFMVAAMTWLILPFVSRRMKPWMMRNWDGSARLEG